MWHDQPENFRIKHPNLQALLNHANPQHAATLVANATNPLDRPARNTR